MITSRLSVPVYQPTVTTQRKTSKHFATHIKAEEAGPRLAGHSVDWRQVFSFLFSCSTAKTSCTKMEPISGQRSGGAMKRGASASVSTATRLQHHRCTRSKHRPGHRGDPAAGGGRVGVGAPPRNQFQSSSRPRRTDGIGQHWNLLQRWDGPAETRTVSLSQHKRWHQKRTWL